MASTAPKLRSAVLALGFSAITVTGVIYGASLRSERANSKQQEQRREMTTEERIAHLEGRREELISQRNVLDGKIQEFERKAASRKAQKDAVTSGR